MLIPVIAELFKFKVVSNIIVLTCNWQVRDQVTLTRQFSQQGLTSTFLCDPSILKDVVNSRFQGVLYFKENAESLLNKVKPEHFAHWYKWMIIGDGLPDRINMVRYDSDVTYIRNNSSIFETINEPVHLEDVHVHPDQGASIHPWAFWTKASGLNVVHNNKRIFRRLNMKKYPLKIVAPMGYYSPKTYNGTFTDYLQIDVDPQRDSAIRSSYLTSSMILEMLNATEVLLETHFWSAESTSDSMLSMVRNEVGDISGAILRLLPARMEVLDYILPIWPFGVGFVYLAERESSSNMYIEPFSAGVWWTCLGIGFVLAVSQRVTARGREEKEGAFVGVLATFLQQDASAVPQGVSGRWSFIVMSVSAMLIHAYYTSAIVSALMSTGRGGPVTLRALGDSKYTIASEDYEYMRYLFWEVDTNWTELEYLKKKKMKLPSLYVDIKKGVEMIGDGSTAYHTEYNKIYPLFNTFHDDQVCKLQYVPTIPEQLTWTTASKRCQFTDIFRSRGAWLHETGLAARVVSLLKMRPPPCRAALLAERVKLGDVVPLLTLTALGAVLSLIVLGVEMLYVRARKRTMETDKSIEVEDVSVYEIVA